MVRILFICHGNICRSPIAEFIMKKLVQERGLSERFVIASAATSYEEEGTPIYPPAGRILQENGISSAGHRARRAERSDYVNYDFFVCMEEYNVRNLMRILRSDPEGKVCRLLDYTDDPGDIDDPWYTGDFETAYRQIRKGCEGLLKALQYSR